MYESFLHVTFGHVLQLTSHLSEISEISANISLEVKETDIQLSLTDMSDNTRKAKAHNTPKYVARVYYI